MDDYEMSVSEQIIKKLMKKPHFIWVTELGTSQSQNEILCDIK